MDAQGFTVLFVCTGNICRSPIAERLAAAWTADQSPSAQEQLSFTSAGTAAVEGAAMTHQASAVVRAHGGDPDRHRARALSRELLAQAGVVLVMTRGHRADVVRLLPAAVHRTHTVREAARLALAVAPGLPPGGPAARWRSLAARLGPARGSLLASGPGEDDVIDPFQESQEVYDLCTAQLLPALTTLVDVARASP